MSHSLIKGDLGVEKSIYSLIISLASQLDSNIGYVVSHSLIKGHLGVKRVFFFIKFNYLIGIST